ncbi:MAG: hypothetical protein AB2551_11360 [Candidatus Thiodiazotropha sp.]
MSTPNLFTNSAAAQSYTAVDSGMGSTQQTEGETLFQQASQSHQPEVLVKRQFEQRNQSQKSKLAIEFISSAGREGISQLAATPDGQHALAVVYDHAGSDGRGLMRQVHEEQGNTAVDYTLKSELICTAQAAQQGERTPEEQYLNSLMKQYADHVSGEMPLPPSESLRLRSEIERVSEIVNPGQHNLWGDYSPQEEQYLEDQTLKQKQAANNLGIWVGGPVFSAMPALGRVLDAPEPVVEGLGQINAEMAGGKAFGRQGRGIEPVRAPISSGPLKAYVLDTKGVRIEQPGSVVQSQGVAPSSQLTKQEALQHMQETLRYRQLSWNHEQKKYSVIEAHGVSRAEQALGRRFEPSNIEGVDFLDPTGLGKISLKGPFLDKKLQPLKVEYQQKAVENILKHVEANKAVDIHIIDTKGLNDEVLMTLQETLKKSQSKIHYLR